MAITRRTEFENTTQMWIGFIRIDIRGDVKSMAVEPFGRVMLSEDEQQLTADAHAEPGGNPFIDHHVELRDPRTQDVIESFVAPLLRRATSPRPTGAAEQPAGEPLEGTAAAGEEVGVPQASAV